MPGCSTTPGLLARPCMPNPQPHYPCTHGCAPFCPLGKDSAGHHSPPGNLLPLKTPHTQSAPWALHHANGREGPWSQSLGSEKFGCYIWPCEPWWCIASAILIEPRNEGGEGRPQGRSSHLGRTKNRGVGVSASQEAQVAHVHLGPISLLSLKNALSQHPQQTKKSLNPTPTATLTPQPCLLAV